MELSVAVHLPAVPPGRTYECGLPLVFPRPPSERILPAALDRVRPKLAAALDGDRQMVDILTTVLSDGLPAVEAACVDPRLAARR